MAELFVILVILILYFLPTFLAYKTDHPRKTAIMLTNIFGGLISGIGWVIALVWVYVRDDKPNSKQ